MKSGVKHLNLSDIQCDLMTSSCSAPASLRLTTRRNWTEKKEETCCLLTDPPPPSQPRGRCRRCRVRRPGGVFPPRTSSPRRPYTGCVPALSYCQRLQEGRGESLTTDRVFTAGVSTLPVVNQELCGLQKTKGCYCPHVRELLYYVYR